jgi:hypothetical protein
MNPLCLAADLLCPLLTLVRLLCGKRRLRMGRWVQSRRLISDLHLGILLLILGFIASGALIVFLAYPLVR